VPQAELVPREGKSDTFGWSLALQGSRALVGAPSLGDRTGAVHAFERLGTTWQEQAAPQVTNLEPGDGFGTTVAMSGDLALVGCGGPTYLFRRDGDGWDQPSELLPPADIEEGDLFGGTIAISGDTILVGASLDSTFDASTGTTRRHHGSAFVYRIFAQGASVVTIEHTGGEVILQCTGEAGATYLLERSSILSDWSPIRTVTVPVGGAFTVSDDNPPLASAFYCLKRL
jgi:hypothetical protein